MPERREDDLIDEAGCPLSPAHKAMYDRMDTMCDEVGERIKSLLYEHQLEWHVILKDGRKIKDLLEQSDMDIEQTLRGVIDLTKVVDALTDVVIGPPKVDPLTKTPYRDLEGHVMREEGKGLRHHLKNGGGVPARFRMTKGIASVIVAVIMTLGGIGAAIIAESHEVTQQEVRTIVSQVIQEYEVQYP